MQSKDSILNEQFHWISQTTKQISKSDVSINLVFWDKQNSKDKAFHIVFRNKATAIGDYVQIAVSKNRLLIRPVSTPGLKLWRRKENPNRYLKIKETEETEGLREFIGDYELMFDPFYEIYYIERKEGAGKQ